MEKKKAKKKNSKSEDTKKDGKSTKLARKADGKLGKTEKDGKSNELARKKNKKVKESKKDSKKDSKKGTKKGTKKDNKKDNKKDTKKKGNGEKLARKATGEVKKETKKKDGEKLVKKDKKDSKKKEIKKSPKKLSKLKGNSKKLALSKYTLSGTTTITWPPYIPSETTFSTVETYSDEDIYLNLIYYTQPIGYEIFYNDEMTLYSTCNYEDGISICEKQNKMPEIFKIAPHNTYYGAAFNKCKKVV